MSDTKPREFWIIGDRAHPDGHIVPDIYKHGIHVIEYSEVERLRAILKRFIVHGTDGCKTCETGRVTLFIANDQCIGCNPESYEP